MSLIPGASATERSAEAARRLIEGGEFQSGQTYGFRLRLEPVWAPVTDPAFGRLIVDQSLAFLRAARPSEAGRIEDAA